MNRLLPRSLFARLFAAFTLALGMAVLVFLLLSLSLRETPLAYRYFANHSGPAVVAATLVAEVYERDGTAAGENALRLLERETGFHAALFDGDARFVIGITPTPAMTACAERLAHSERTGTAIPGYRELTTTYPIRTSSGRRFVLVGQLRRGLVSNLIAPTLRTLGILLVALVTCYFLARTLTAPIDAVRQAARRIAAGDLTARARISDINRGRTDEIADLGRDFDAMADRLEAAISAQRRLLADISHELRSPLARLNVALELARQRAGDTAGASLNRIERETERMNTLIGELLSLSRLETGGARMENRPVELAALLGDIAADADFEAKARGCTVTVTVERDATVNGDAELLRRAVENVVRNAVRYTAEGTAVEAALTVDENRTARITVRDHGPGVPETALPHLFQPFYRVEDDRDRATGGTGLGLAITERAVRLHGGTIAAANAPDGGLLVTITLPSRPGGGERDISP